MDDNLNPIHNIFIWILSVFYRANKNEYDWIGFKVKFKFELVIIYNC